VWTLVKGVLDLNSWFEEAQTPLKKIPQKTQANGFLKGAPDRDMQVAQSARELDAVAAVGLLAH